MFVENDLPALSDRAAPRQKENCRAKREPYPGAILSPQFRIETRTLDTLTLAGRGRGWRRDRGQGRRGNRNFSRAVVEDQARQQRVRTELAAVAETVGGAVVGRRGGRARNGRGVAGERTDVRLIEVQLARLEVAILQPEVDVGRDRRRETSDELIGLLSKRTVSSAFRKTVTHEQRLEWVPLHRFNSFTTMQAVDSRGVHS